MTDRYWPIVFAAMARAAETKSTDLAEGVAKLVSAREASDAARFHYVCLRAYVGGKVGMPDTDDAATGDADAPPLTPRGGPANNRK